MKKALSLFFGLGTICLVYAQQTHQTVIASSGNHDQINTTSIEWTLGELAVQSLEGSNIMLTEGFHQPQLYVDPILEPPNLSLNNHINVTVSPNPTRGILYIKINPKLDERAMLSLIALDGRLVQKETINFTQGNFEWDISEYDAAVYLLTIHIKRENILRSFKIVNIN